MDLAKEYPENPVVVRLRRAGLVESLHRGAWVVTGATGQVLAGAGHWTHPFFVRSSIKCVQILPLFETGAVERLAFTDEEVALAVSSHSGEPCHTELVASLLERLGHGEADLRCGEQMPVDSATRCQLRERGLAPNQLHNNCSGKHAGFLALAHHLGTDRARYLDPDTQGQQLVRSALAELTDTDPATLTPALDGCSAPTYRLSLAALALAFARVANPDGLRAPQRDACQRVTRAVARNPVLVAGNRKRLCTDISRATSGRLFAKIGAEAVYAIGEVGGERALAVKIDDGGQRGLNALVLALMRRHGFASRDELAALQAWSDPVLRNWAGLEVGSIEAMVE